MKKCFFMLFCVFTIFLCNGMENPETILDQSEKMKDVRFAQYLTHKEIVIGNNKGTSIFNRETRKQKNIGYCGLDIVVNQTCKKIVLPVSNTLTLYNSVTGECEWMLIEKYPIYRSIIHSIKPIVFLCCTPIHEKKFIITHYDYNEHIRGKETINFQDAFCPSIALHPKEDIICIGQYSGNVSFYTSNNLSMLKNIRLSQDCSDFCHYSFDGSFVLIGNSRHVFIINTDIKSGDYPDSPYLPRENKYKFRKIIFYPHSFIVAGLLTRKNKETGKLWTMLRYWDALTRKPINVESWCKEGVGQDLSFSPDGKQILIALHDEWIILPVPLEIIYEADIKQRMPYLFFVINQWQTLQELPKDVIGYFKAMFIQSFKR